jgi:hypothetical protein
MAGKNGLDVDFQHSKLFLIQPLGAGSEGFGAGGGHLYRQEDASACESVDLHDTLLH